MFRDVGVKKWSPFCDSGARSPIFWALMQTCDLLGFSFTGTYQELQQEVIQLVPWVPWGAKRWQKMPIGAKRWQKMARGGWWRFSGEQPSQQTVSPHSRDICGLELRYNKTPWLNTKFTSRTNLTQMQQGRNKERLERCCDKLDV